jgi:hypothetical protein
MNLDTLLGVQHPSVQGVGAGEAIDERAETYALHDSANSDGTGAGHFI